MTNHTAFGLALGGGFLHGHAHVGVLGVLEERALHPGWLAGTSAGAVAAAFAAFGISAAETETALSELSWSKMTRARPRGRLGWATNEGLEEIVRSSLGNARIEDSDIPLGIVASDINTGERVLLDRGDAASAVRASCCVPGIYKPVERGGRLLVDGALVENVPARAVREMGAPLVVAVSLGSALPFQPVKSWVQVMWNALDISVNSQMRFEILAEADILIDPDLDGLSKMRTRDRVEIIEAGRHRAEEAIPALEELLEAEKEGAVARWMKAVRERISGERA